MLLAAMAVTVLLRDGTDTIVIGLVIGLNTTVGVIHEVRADHAVAAELLGCLALAVVPGLLVTLGRHWPARGRRAPAGA